MMDHFTFLVVAYSLIFGVIFLYVLFVWRRQAALESELRAMEDRLKALVPQPESEDDRAEPRA
jgi:CcmD family protein